jgi:hypothetical protein
MEVPGGRTEDTNQTEGIRALHARPQRRGDREDRAQDGRGGVGADPASHEAHRVHGSAFAVVNKKSREQFEIRVHKRLIYLTNVTTKAVDALQKLDLPAGVDIEIKV